MASQQQQESKTIPLKILVDKQSNKVVFVEATKDFVETLFSFLSLPLGTIVRLLATNNNNDQQQRPQSQSESSPFLVRIRNLYKYFVYSLFSFLSLTLATINRILATNDNEQQSSPFLGNINNLYQSVQNTSLNDVWNNPVCKQMLLHPRNPCEALCLNLFMNVDDTVPSSKFFVCDSCYKFTTFKNLDCICGKPMNRQPQNLDSEHQGKRTSGVFVRDNGSTFMVFDDLKIVPSSLVNSMQLLMDLGYSDLTQLEEIKHNIGKQEILNLLKYTLTSHEPLTNTLLASSSKIKDNLPYQSASTFKGLPCTSTSSKMDIKVVQSKSQKKIIIAEANRDFVNFIFSFLTIPLGSIVKLFDGNFLAGCVGNLYKSVENLDSSLCTDSNSVLLNPGLAPQFGCPNQPLNIPDVKHPTYYYGTGTPKQVYSYNYGCQTIEVTIEGGVISKTKGSIYKAKLLTPLDPRSSNRSKEGVVGFVKRETLYCIGDDLTVKPLSANSCLAYLKELGIPLDDLEVKMISIGETEALSLLAASLTSKFTLTGGLGDLLNVSNDESTFLKVPKQEPT